MMVKAIGKWRDDGHRPRCDSFGAARVIRHDAIFMIAIDAISRVSIPDSA
jgi:hypothetical protein